MCFQRYSVAVYLVRVFTATDLFSQLKLCSVESEDRCRERSKFYLYDLLNCASFYYDLILNWFELYFYKSLTQSLFIPFWLGWIVYLMLKMWCPKCWSTIYLQSKTNFALTQKVKSRPQAFEFLSSVQWVYLHDKVSLIFVLVLCWMSLIGMSREPILTIPFDAKITKHRRCPFFLSTVSADASC